MNKSPHGKSPHGKREPLERKSYEAPRLRLHGELEKLTRGGTQATPEDLISGTRGGT